MVIAAFSASGTSSCLKLLDAIRNSPEPRVSEIRVILTLDGARQQIYAWQSGADDVLLRPYFATDLVTATRDALERREKDRPLYRRQRIDELRRDDPVLDTETSRPQGTTV